jgi:hypothetical protein
MLTFNFSYVILFNGIVLRACVCLFIAYFDRFIDAYSIDSYYDTTNITRFSQE